MKRIIPLALCALFVSGCGQDAAPTPSPDRTPAASTDKPEAKPAAAPPVAVSVEPQAATVFANQVECEKAGYGAAQCVRAASTAATMAQEDHPTYSSQVECKKLFAKCSGIDAKRASYPQMVAFSIGNEAKTTGAPPPPSADKPLWHTPVYQNAKGELVYIKRTASGQVSAFPIASNKKE